MKMISKAIASLYPNAEYVIENEDYDKIRWVKNQPENFVTKEELEIEVDRLEAIESSLEYQRLRRPEYPSLADLADALYWQSKGNDIKMAAYLAAVDAVKTRYPKGGTQ
jgi:hypothetical protein